MHACKNYIHLHLYWIFKCFWPYPRFHGKNLPEYIFCVDKAIFHLAKRKKDWSIDDQKADDGGNDNHDDKNDLI